MSNKDLYGAPWTPEELHEAYEKDCVKTCFCGAIMEEYCPGCFRCLSCGQNAVTDYRGWLFFTNNIPNNKKNPVSSAHPS